jgi:hypothetical protein
MDKSQYPNGLLKEIRNSARKADPQLKARLALEIKNQKSLPKEPNCFKTADKKSVGIYIKENL